jgi:ABC-type Fe3+ transport system permease subunit
VSDTLHRASDARQVPATDWQDIRFCVAIGIVYMALTWTIFAKPAWQLNNLNSTAPFFLTLGYIVVRARRQPEKLDEWGITTPLGLPALATALALLGIGVGGCIAATGILSAGGPRFDVSYLPRMADYIVGAFPQQFVMCSVGLVSLARLPVFHGNWRLPLAVGFAFCFAHFALPGKSWATILFELAILTPAGILAAGYFLKFRSILPLTALHAILFVLLSTWSGLALAHH